MAPSTKDLGEEGNKQDLCWASRQKLFSPGRATGQTPLILFSDWPPSSILEPINGWIPSRPVVPVPSVLDCLGSLSLLALWLVHGDYDSFLIIWTNRPWARPASGWSNPIVHSQEQKRTLSKHKPTKIDHEPLGAERSDSVSCNLYDPGQAGRVFFWKVYWIYYLYIKVGKWSHQTAAWQIFRRSSLHVPRSQTEKQDNYQ